MNGSPDIPPTSHLVEHLFRRQSARLIAALTSLVGLAQIDLVEDIVQEALLRALRSWPHAGIPENPEGWLYRTARNLMTDHLRRSALHQRLEDEIVLQVEDRSMQTSLEPTFRDELDDDQLRMLFACCHPALSEDAQIAIALKELCGFSVGEIARAYLVEDATIAQRIVRAKRLFRTGQVPFLLPEPADLPSRLDSVVRVIYLIFNEGYSRHSGELLFSRELTDEAIRLAELLAANPHTNSATLHALLALCYFQGSRFAARQSATGDSILLEDQDRSLWDRAAIAQGFNHLEQATTAQSLSRYHLEAGIASLHAQAATFTQTNWKQMVEWYDQLYALDQSPIVFLNRTVALAFWKGFEVGLTALDNAPFNKTLQNYPYFHAVRAELLIRSGRTAVAIEPLQTAISLTQNRTERTLLSRKLASLIQP